MALESRLVPTFDCRNPAIARRLKPIHDRSNLGGKCRAQAHHARFQVDVQSGSFATTGDDHVGSF